MAAQIVQHWIDLYHVKVISVAALVGALQFIERAFFLTQTNINKCSRIRRYVTRFRFFV